MNNKLQKIITIDGPAGAGKSTLARELARCLNWSYLDTGALYRAIAHTALQRNISPEDRAAVEEMARGLSLTVEPRPDGTAIMVDGRDVTSELRTPEISRIVSAISAWPGVRETLLSTQRTLGAKGEVVAEGRDMGTVVFPNAGLKFFLYAAPESRAKRRHLEFESCGTEVPLGTVLSDIIERDKADISREVSPLKAAPDAVTIDSTNLNVDSVLKVMVNAFRNKFFAKAAE